MGVSLDELNDPKHIFYRRVGEGSFCRVVTLTGPSQTQTTPPSLLLNGEIIMQCAVHPAQLTSQLDVALS